MKMIVPTVKEAFHVHKTMNEYLEDIGEPLLTEKQYEKWLELLLSDKHRYILLMHSRKRVGLVWGSEDDDGAFLVKGSFLRRVYRNKERFTKCLEEAKLEIVKGYDTIKYMVPFEPGIKKARFVII